MRQRLKSGACANGALLKTLLLLLLLLLWDGKRIAGRARFHPDCLCCATLNH